MPVDRGAAAAGTRIGTRLWSMANTLRAAGVRPADYQAFIIPLLMYKVVCDRNDEARAAHVAEYGEADWEQWKETLAPFDVPDGADYASVRATAVNSGEALTDALLAITEANQASLAGVFLHTDYGQLSDQVLGDLFATMDQVSFSLAETSQDALGAAYEYLLGKFADAAGAKAGQYFTPVSVADLLVRITDPQPGESVYDPACGSGGLLSAAAAQVAAAGAERTSVALHGQELDEQAFAIARVNMFLHGNAGAIRRGDTLLDPLFRTDAGLQTFSAVVANPPFGLEFAAVDVWAQDRWGRNRWGAATRKGSELLFVAHIASSMEAGAGRAAVVLPMGALFRAGAEAGIRTALLEAGLVEAVVALPANLFFNTSIPAYVLVLRVTPRHPGQVLFVDASECFTKSGKQSVMRGAHVDEVSEVLRTGKPTPLVRAALVPVAEVVAAEADLTCRRWLPPGEVDVADVGAALAGLRAAEGAAGAAADNFWAAVGEAGYGA